jgi:glucose 1-dehydrogenase
MIWHAGIQHVLEGRHAVVTGAGSGIGRATAELFAAQGARVTLADIDDASVQETAARIASAGGEAVAVATDVGRLDQIECLIATGVNAFGPPRTIFSNAAGYTRGPAHEVSEEDWDRTLAVCLKATWMLARTAMPLMIENGGGTFIVTSSVHAIWGYRRHAAYQAAKGGLEALTRSLAADYAPAVRVNSIIPGAIVTGLWRDVPPEKRAANAARTPLQRNAEPEEVAWTALFLASEMSSYITGQSIVVDGGLTSISGM